MEKPMYKLCGHRHLPGEPHVLTGVGPRGIVTRTVTRPARVTPSVTPGKPCPTCGHDWPMTGAQRQRRYREAKRG